MLHSKASLYRGAGALREAAGERLDRYMTMQQPHPLFFSSISSGGSGVLTTDAARGGCDIGLGPASGLIGGLSGIRGMVE